MNIDYSSFDIPVLSFLSQIQIPPICYVGLIRSSTTEATASWGIFEDTTGSEGTVIGATV